MNTIIKRRTYLHLMHTGMTPQANQATFPDQPNRL